MCVGYGGCRSGGVVRQESPWVVAEGRYPAFSYEFRGAVLEKKVFFGCFFLGVIADSV